MKLQYIQQLQKEGHRVMMLGDGLNDAGALKQSNVGFAVTGKNGTFFPACDGMLRADSLTKLDALMHQAVKSMDTVRYSFIISFTYNVIGLSFAVRSVLQPVIAAVLMPVSSVSVIAFTVLLTSWFAKKSKL
jgi:Cu+-exporting ATPase